MKPHFKNKDYIMFLKYLNNSKSYLEFGSGGSTFEVSKKSNIEKIISIESDSEWHKFLKNKIPKTDKINFIYCDMKTKPKTWGNPGEDSTLEDWKNYSNQAKLAKDIDLILIDGRFRVACCLKCFKYIDENTIILFDDFLVRKPYHIVLDYFKIIEYTSDKNMVVLKKKNVLPPTMDIISKYEKKKG